MRILVATVIAAALLSGCVVTNEAPQPVEATGLIITIEHESGPTTDVLIEAGDSTDGIDVLNTTRFVGPGHPTTATFERKPGHSYTVVITIPQTEDGVFHTFPASSCGGGNIAWELRIVDGRIEGDYPTCPAAS